MNPLNEADIRKLRSLLEIHVAETGSVLATTLLQNFEAEVAHFTCVLPRDYASVLQIRARATSEGIDPDGEAVWKEILEVTNG
jgi:glutamate synthase (NADPH/NADH) large chain